MGERRAAHGDDHHRMRTKGGHNDQVRPILDWYRQRISRQDTFANRDSRVLVLGRFLQLYSRERRLWCKKAAYREDV